MCQEPQESSEQDGEEEQDHEKFDIVQGILPDLANKISEQLGKPVPDLSRTISKIMNVVWIEPSVEKSKESRKITYTIYNYTVRPHSFMIHLQIPAECMNDTITGGPMFDSANEEGKSQWLVKDLEASSSVQISFELKGDMADTFDADDVYISGINPVMVMGAESLPGDWGIKGMKITEENDYVPDDTDDEEEEEALEDEEAEFEKEADE